MRLTQPLTPAEHRKIRLHLALIPVYAWLLIVWTAYAIDMGVSGPLDRSGHIKGHDFVHFYVLGQMAVDGASGELYSFEAHAARTDRLVPQYEDRFLPVHGPQVALFFAPLARMPYQVALTIWLILSAIVYAGCCVTLWTALPNLRPYGWIAALLCAGSPALYTLVSAGQTSAFALAWLTAAFLALRNGRPWLAGFALGALAYKPTLGLVLPFAFVYARQWRVVLGATVSAALQFGIAWAYFGTTAILGYVANARTAVEHVSLLEAQLSHMHSLRSFFAILLPWPTVAAAFYFATAVVVIAMATRTWRTGAPLEPRYAVLLTASVLVDPHVYSYELVVLVPALMLAASWAIGRGAMAFRFWPLLYLCYYLPALRALTIATGIQWSVPALVTLTLVLAQSARSRSQRSAGGWP